MKINYIPTAEQLADIESIKAEFAKKREKLNAVQAEERKKQNDAKRQEEDYYCNKLRGLKREQSLITAEYDKRVNERNKERNNELDNLQTDDKRRAEIEYNAAYEIINIKLEKKTKIGDIDDTRGKLNAEHSEYVDRHSELVMAMNQRHAAEQLKLTDDKKHAIITYMQNGKQDE